MTQCGWGSLHAQMQATITGLFQLTGRGITNLFPALQNAAALPDLQNALRPRTAPGTADSYKSSLPPAP